MVTAATVASSVSRCRTIAPITVCAFVNNPCDVPSLAAGVRPTARQSVESLPQLTDTRKATIRRVCVRAKSFSQMPVDSRQRARRQ